MCVTHSMKDFCLSYSYSKVLSWSWRTVEAGLLCFTAQAQATRRWSSSCWTTMPMPTSSECIHFSETVQRSNQAEVFITFSTIHREPGSGFTPLMEAAASGHEIIVQNLLDHVSFLLHKCALYHSRHRATAQRSFWGVVMTGHVLFLSQHPFSFTERQSRWPQR